MIYLDNENIFHNNLTLEDGSLCSEKSEERFSFFYEIKLVLADYPLLEKLKSIHFILLSWPARQESPKCAGNWRWFCHCKRRWISAWHNDSFFVVFLIIFISICLLIIVYIRFFFFLILLATTITWQHLYLITSTWEKCNYVT